MKCLRVLLPTLLLLSAACGSPAVTVKEVTGYQLPPAIYTVNYAFEAWDGTGKVMVNDTSLQGDLTVVQGPGNAYLLAGAWLCSSSTAALHCEVNGADNGWTIGFGAYRTEVIGDVSASGGVISDTYFLTSADTAVYSSDQYTLGALTRVQ